MSELNKALAKSALATKEKIKLIKDSIDEENQQAEKNKDLEEGYWTRFQEIVANKIYFDLDHVHQLCREVGIEYDILFVLAKKNVGKTRQIYRLFDQAIKEDSKVVYGRMSRAELDTNRADFNTDEHNPLELKNIGGSTQLFDRIDQGTLAKSRGKGVDFKFCQKAGGGEYKDYKYIIFDEVISYDPRNTFNENHLRNWAAFLSTVIRNKKGLKVYLFGNMLENSNLNLLQFYGIERTDNLRYIVRNPNNPCKILFINLRALYRGIESQAGGTQHMSPEFRHGLVSNADIPKSEKIIEFKTFDGGEYFDVLGAFVYNIKNTPYIVQLNHSIDQGDDRVIAVHITPFNSYASIINNRKETIPIYTTNAFLSMQYANLTFASDVRFFLEEIYYMTKFNKIYFTTGRTIDHAFEVFEEIAPIIESRLL